MRYSVVIEEGNETTAFGVIVPDLPGCFSAGDTLDEAMANVEEAAAAWIDTALDAGQPVPPPSSLEDIKSRTEYRDWTFAVVNVNQHRPNPRTLEAIAESYRNDLESGESVDAMFAETRKE